MQQSHSWEANRCSASQEIPRILWNPKVHYRIHKGPTPVPILSQLDPAVTPISHFLKIHLNIILPSAPVSPKWASFPQVSHQNPVYASPLTYSRYMSRPSHSSRFYHPNNTGCGLQIVKLLIMLFSSFVYYLLPPTLKYSPQHTILRHPQPTFLPQCERPSFTPIQNNRQHYMYVYLNL